MWAGMYLLPELSLIYVETPKSGKGQKKAKLVNKEIFISQLFLRGDSGKMNGLYC